jgi:hypothetical protein
MFPRADRGPGFDLPRNPLRKIRCSSVVDWDDDYSPQDTPEEHGHPFRAVFSPEQNAITFDDSALSKFMSELGCAVVDFPVSPTFCSISTPVNVGILRPALSKILHKLS